LNRNQCATAISSDLPPNPVAGFGMDSPVKMTKKWLRTYEPSEPFAEDFRTDSLGVPKWPAPRTLKALLSYLRDRRACPEAVEGARIAWREFAWDRSRELSSTERYTEGIALADELIGDDSCDLLAPVSEPEFDLHCGAEQLRTALHHMKREGSGFMHNRNIIFLSWEADEVAAYSDGTGLMVFKPDGESVTMDIVWVHPEFRRQDRATHMIQELRTRYPGALRADPVSDEGAGLLESLPFWKRGG